jgi:hypothetical protein
MVDRPKSAMHALRDGVMSIFAWKRNERGSLATIKDVARLSDPRGQCASGGDLGVALLLRTAKLRGWLLSAGYSECRWNFYRD